MLQRFRSLGNRSVSLSKVSWHEKLGGNRYQQLCFLAYCASYDFMHLQLLKTFFKAGPTMLSFYYVLHSLIFGNLLWSLYVSASQCMWILENFRANTSVYLKQVFEIVFNQLQQSTKIHTFKTKFSHHRSQWFGVNLPAHVFDPNGRQWLVGVSVMSLGQIVIGWTNPFFWSLWIGMAHPTDQPKKMAKHMFVHCVLVVIHRIGCSISILKLESSHLHDCFHRAQLELGLTERGALSDGAPLRQATTATVAA